MPGLRRPGSIRPLVLPRRGVLTDTGGSRGGAGAPARSPFRAWRTATAAIGWAACAGVVALLLAAVARPIATDDAWWHLALGRVFARDGPWLTGDPLLFTAPRPASNASWLADVLLAQVLALGGFTGL